MDTEPHIENPEPQPATERPNIADWRDHDRAGAGGATDASPGSPGETTGTGDAREEDR